MNLATVTPDRNGVPDHEGTGLSVTKYNTTLSSDSLETGYAYPKSKPEDEESAEHLLDRALASMENLTEVADAMTRRLDELLK